MWYVCDYMECKTLFDAGINISYIIIIFVQDPNNLDAKVLSEFDHVKKEVDLDSDELKQLREDPAYGINMSGDTKRILQELGTEKGRDIASSGGGGDKTQREHAAAVAALKAAKKVGKLIFFFVFAARSSSGWILAQLFSRHSYYLICYIIEAI